MAISQRIFVGAALAAALSQGACATDPDAEPVTSNGAAVSWEEFRDSTFRDFDGDHVVDGHIGLETDAELRAFYDALFPTRGALVIQKNPDGSRAKQPDELKRHLTCCVSGAFGAHKAALVAALTAGADAWEAAADVDFVYVPAQDAACTATNANVYFRSSMSPAAATSRAPSARAPRAAGASSSSTPAPSTSSGRSGTSSVTSSGTVLGFRHEHTRPEAGTCFEDNNWLPLTPYDSASIMNYPQCNGTARR
jgi:hypothetical protein